LRKAIISVDNSSRPSTWHNMASAKRDFHEILYSIIFRKSAEKNSSVVLI